MSFSISMRFSFLLLNTFIGITVCTTRMHLDKTRTVSWLQNYVPRDTTVKSHSTGIRSTSRTTGTTTTKLFNATEHGYHTKRKPQLDLTQQVTAVNSYSIPSKIVNTTATGNSTPKPPDAASTSQEFTDSILETETGFYSENVQWTVMENIHEYSEYSDVSLLSIHVPANTEKLVLLLRGDSKPAKCKLKNVTIYIQHGGYPVINPNNESFPDYFHIERSSLHQFSIASSNATLSEELAHPLPGTWFLAVFRRKAGDRHLPQEGFSKTCKYNVYVKALNEMNTDVWDIALVDSQTVSLGSLNQERLFRFQVPEEVVAYRLVVNECIIHTADNETKVLHPCPVSLSLSEGSMLASDTPQVNCTRPNTACSLKMESPLVGMWTFLKVVRNYQPQKTDVFSFSIRFYSYECDSSSKILQLNKLRNNFTQENFTSDKFASDYSTHGLFASHYHLLENSSVSSSHVHLKSSCLATSNLGRYNLDAHLFRTAFLFHSYDLTPNKVNELFLPDQFFMTASFRIIEALDSGATLEVHLSLADSQRPQQQAIWLCLMKNRIPYEMSFKTLCANGVMLHVNSTVQRPAAVYIPYPGAGLWYLAFQSKCYRNNDTTSLEKCTSPPLITFSVLLSPCFRKCGSYGNCYEYVSNIYVFSSCDCFAGWRGYGCTDGSEANSMRKELMSTLLLSLSNLFFIPGICLALYRHYYIEALVFTFNMFFSTFYHACDSSKIYQLCIISYDTLGFADFLGSFVSFWMVLLAMAKIPSRVRECLHMVGVLMIAVFMNYNRHGALATMVPLGLAGVITLGSWIYRMIKYKKLFPSKKRWLKFLLPGFILGASGLIIFATIETEENYMYTHSFWHIVITLSIMFLLPPRRKEKKGPEVQTVKSISRNESAQLLDPSVSSEENLIT